ncbi:putative flavin-nucleotide-binding protein [Sedimentisphaera cyanobacteriorum]|uniref:Putative flavin-nucleotide-binding protein n=1 Tax=Sedimentisphaera cyanobacteriorum TaxID=1940790 RepID=A0A1Q2HQX9_9BACT|nr:pyridoxamine 5'-phosphate oxidase family protein [Sedimentisphaera cyanobacteriorum]AQQ09869.1 putative flavin-nucleotide-binding protein [Sedimentisphaera cyanobacteriorum]
MRKMTETEINELVKNSNWATICTVTPDGLPYAIEATYFIDGKYIGFMINPRGRTMQNLKHNPNLILKITQASGDLSKWAGVSLFGTGQNITDSDAIRKGWELLGEVMNTDYTTVTEKCNNTEQRSPYLKCTISQITGRSS